MSCHFRVRLAALWTLALVFCFVADAARPATAASEPRIIRIGAVVDQTGGSTSPLYRAAVELAASQMNAALDRNGSRVKFEVVFGDSKSNPPFAQSEALRLINQEQVKALVTDSSGVTIAINKLNYDPATPAKQKVPITCFQCSSSFINDANVTESDPVTQAAERDVDNWLFRVFYVAKYEAAVLVQIALNKTNGGKGNGDGTFKIGILADGGHRALATGIAAVLPSFYKDPSSTEIIYMSALDKLGADWAKGDRHRQRDHGKDRRCARCRHRRDAAGSGVGGDQGLSAGRPRHPDPVEQQFPAELYSQAGGRGRERAGGQFRDARRQERIRRGLRQGIPAATGQSPEMTSSGAYDATATLMLAALVAAGDAKRPRDVAPADIRDGLAKINNKSGQKVRPTVEGFSSAIRLIAKGKPINYEGAYDSGDWDAAGDMFPPLVHWKVENQQFVEYELYRCSPQQPLCPAK